MTDTHPKMHKCANCGFMSIRGSEFEMVGDEKLCKSCIKQYTELFYFEADGGVGLIRGRSKLLTYEELAARVGVENIAVFREATEEDIARVKAEGGRTP